MVHAHSFEMYDQPLIPPEAHPKLHRVDQESVSLRGHSCHLSRPLFCFVAEYFLHRLSQPLHHGKLCQSLPTFLFHPTEHSGQQDFGQRSSTHASLGASLAHAQSDHQSESRCLCGSSQTGWANEIRRWRPIHFDHGLY